jgi:hypothetical protein
MIPIKIQCSCGQRYSFEIEPVNGAMPSPVACPVCGADGTEAANGAITQALAAAPVATAAPAGLVLDPMAGSAASMSAPAGPPRLRTARATGNEIPGASLPAAPVSAAASNAGARPAEREWGPGGKGDTWKWWYYVLAGLCIGGYSIWQAYDQQRVKPLGELFLAVFLIAIGVWDFQRKRKRRVRG